MPDDLAASPKYIYVLLRMPSMARAQGTFSQQMAQPRGAMLRHAAWVHRRGL
jgi:hypothetical protein